MVTVTVVAPAPAAICVGLKLQLTVASGRPLQAKVTVLTKVVAPPVGVILKVKVVDSPAGAGCGEVGVVKLKLAAVASTVVVPVDALSEASPGKEAVIRFAPAEVRVGVIVATPPLNSAVPIWVVALLTVVEKVTIPTAVDGDTVAVKVTSCPRAILEGVAVTVVVDTVRARLQARASWSASIDPRPVTRL